MTVTKADCDAVRDIALDALRLSDCVFLGVNTPSSYTREGYTPKERSLLLDFAISADAIAKEWHALWTTEVSDWFYLKNPGNRYGDLLTVIETVVIGAAGSAKVMAEMLTDGYSTTDEIRDFVGRPGFSTADILAEWVNAVNGLPNAPPSEAEAAEGRKFPPVSFPNDELTTALIKARQAAVKSGKTRSKEIAELHRVFQAKHKLTREVMETIKRNSREYRHLWEPSSTAET